MTDKLFEEWIAYQKLLENDYMDHRAFFGRLLQYIQVRFDRPLAVLDLGCGDTQPIRHLLESLDVSRFVGIDESTTALSKAKDTLEFSGLTLELIEGDLTRSLSGIEGSFDVIVASFSLHHLVGAQAKQTLLSCCRSLLADDGMLAVIDVFHQEGEARDDYIARWIEFADRHYQALTQREKKLLFDHVRARDYPESMSTYRRISLAEDLADFEILLVDKENLNHLVVMAPAG